MAQHQPPWMPDETTATGDVESRQALVRRFARVASRRHDCSLQHDRIRWVMGQWD